MNKNPLDDLIDRLFLSARRRDLESLRDQQLLQRYTSHHDELALGEVVHRHGAMVWAICRRTLGRRRDTEDIYQATFLKLIRLAVFVQRCKSVESWLHTAAHNTAVNAHRMLDRQSAREKRRAKMYGEGYTDPRDTGDLADILNKEVGYLPEKCRGPIILCYLEGLTPEQAARRIKITTPCLKRRLVEGRQRLHRRLSKRGIELDSSMLMAGLTSNLHSQQVPPGLMEKTLHMVRILTQSNSALEPAENSSGVVLLAKSTLETWTFKAKLLLALLLVMFIVAGGSMITYAGWLAFRGEQTQERLPTPAKKVRQKLETNEVHLPLMNNDDHLLLQPAFVQLGIACFGLDKFL